MGCSCRACVKCSTSKRLHFRLDLVAYIAACVGYIGLTVGLAWEVYDLW